MAFTNRLKDARTSGATLRGAWCASPSAEMAEAVASVGFDYVCVDMQHGLVDYADAVHMFMAIAGQGSVPIARLVVNDPALIGKVIDAGALGVVVPLVNTAEQAAAAVAATRYPPRGGRSFGPARASLAVGSKAIADLESIFVAVMVETGEGLDNVDEIAAVEGIDAIYCGPADLALAIGLEPAYERPEPEHEAAIQRIREACHRNDIIAGIHCADGAMAARRLAQGFQMTTIMNDLALVRSAATAELAAASAPE